MTPPPERPCVDIGGFNAPLRGTLGYAPEFLERPAHEVGRGFWLRCDSPSSDRNYGHASARPRSRCSTAVSESAAICAPISAVWTTTLLDHMPTSHRAHAEWTRTSLINWGASIGANTCAVVEHVQCTKEIRKRRVVRGLPG